MVRIFIEAPTCRNCISRRGKPYKLASHRLSLSKPSATIASGRSRDMVQADSPIDEINARVVGRQEPTLIFVHGFACALDDWDRQVEALSPRFRCVALDLPGHGGSPRTETASIAVMGGAVNSVRAQHNPRWTQHGFE